MKELIELLKQAAGTGEVMTISYGGGSRSGSPRSLVIATCSDTEFHAIEEGARAQKHYKIEKILWAENSSGMRIENAEAISSFKPPLPSFGSLKEYADHLRPEFEQAGWYIHQTDNTFGVGTCFKNGKPKKTPSIAVAFYDTSRETVWDFDQDDFVEVEKEPSGRERPWRVDSWRFKQGKTFGLLHSAMEMFVEEVRGSSPEEAKGMFAGH